MNEAQTRTHKTLSILLGLMAIGCFAGGYYGMSGAAQLPLEWLNGSPFPDYFIPSLFLFAVVGGVNLIASILIYKRHRWSQPAGHIAGLLVLAWTAAQVAIIGYQSWMQPAVAIIGIFVILLTAQLPRYAS